MTVRQPGLADASGATTSAAIQDVGSPLLFSRLVEFSGLAQEPREIRSDFGTLWPDGDGPFGCHDRPRNVSGGHATLAQLQPGPGVAVETDESFKHRNGVGELFGDDQRIGLDGQGVDSILCGQFRIPLQGSCGCSTGVGRIGGLVEVGQGSHQLGVLESRVEGSPQDATGPETKDRCQFPVGLLAGQLAIGQPEATVLVERWEMREVVEWFESSR